MSEFRTVQINIHAVDVSGIINRTDRQEYYKAIGYLSSWNLSFPKVVIWADSEGDLVANYLNEDGTIGYVIGAVWHEDHFGFHS